MRQKKKRKYSNWSPAPSSPISLQSNIHSVSTAQRAWTHECIVTIQPQKTKQKKTTKARLSEVSGKSHFWTNILSQINPAVFLKSQTPTIHKKKKKVLEPLQHSERRLPTWLVLWIPDRDEIELLKCYHFFVFLNIKRMSFWHVLHSLSHLSKPPTSF